MLEDKDVLSVPDDCVLENDRCDSNFKHLWKFSLTIFPFLCGCADAEYYNFGI